MARSTSRRTSKRSSTSRRSSRKPTYRPAGTTEPSRKKYKRVNLLLIGQAFMGRAHSNAWSQCNRHCSPPAEIVFHTVAARDPEPLPAFAERWGWQNWSTDYVDALADPEIDMVDITAPNHMHLEMTAAAVEAGKIICCEKPLSDNLDDAREMVKMVRKSKRPNFMWYNYRRCPAVSYAHQLVRQGALGTIRHVRGYFLQDWAEPDVPLIWRFDKKVAGSGSHGDLGAHAIDMCRFVTGEEITEVCGAVFETFVKERAVMTKASAGGIAGGSKGTRSKKGKVRVDDAAVFLARFEGGAVASFEATRMATGNENKLGFEINGTDGALRFDFERMNELEFCDNTGNRGTKGWRRIIVTHAPDHPYAEHWWPDAHVVGYEHAFTNMAYDITRVLAGQKPIVPLPDFEDAWMTQRVLAAAELSAKEKGPIKLSQVK